MYSLKLSTFLVIYSTFFRSAFLLGVSPGNRTYVLRIKIMTDSVNSTLVSTKEVDYLDEDKPIRGQIYVLLSFLSPEDVIVKKEAYIFSKFIEKFSGDMKVRVLSV